MGPGFFIIFVISTVPTLLLLCLCTLLGIWLALGRTHVAIRMPIFLLGTLAIGLVFCFAARSTHFLGVWSSRPAFAYAVGMALVATIFDRTTNLVFRILALLFGSFILFGTFSHTDLNDLDTTWIIRVALATSFVSCAVGALRGFGFRLVALTEGLSRRDLEKATGHDFDEWFAILDAANGQSLNRAEIMAFLRRHGIKFSWQKTVTLAYERALGRHAVGQAADGQLRVILQETSSDLLGWFTRSPKQQFAIWQMLLYTFCAASLFATVRALGGYAPTIEDIQYLIPITVGVATVAVPTLVASLGVRGVWQKNAVSFFVSLATAVGVLHALGFRPNNAGYSALVITFPIFAGLLMASLMLVRHRGYRLVRVRQTGSLAHMQHSLT